MTLEGQPRSVSTYSFMHRDWSARFWSRNMSEHEPDSTVKFHKSYLAGDFDGRIKPRPAGEPDPFRLDPAFTTFGQVASLHTWGGNLAPVLDHIPAFCELELYANTQLRKRLSEEVFEEIRVVISSNRNIKIEDVNCLLIDDAVKALHPVTQADPAKNGDSLTPPLKPSPVICFQAALARFCHRSPNTAGLAEILKAEGIIQDFAPPAKQGGKYHFWFVDHGQHAKALDEISQKPSRRPAKKRKP
jgi:hypothetical protein